jgi:hypothetical protein
LPEQIDEELQDRMVPIQQGSQATRLAGIQRLYKNLTY